MRCAAAVELLAPDLTRDGASLAERSIGAGACAGLWPRLRTSTCLTPRSLPCRRAISHIAIVLRHHRARSRSPQCNEPNTVQMGDNLGRLGSVAWELVQPVLTDRPGIRGRRVVRRCGGCRMSAGDRALSSERHVVRAEGCGAGLHLTSRLHLRNLRGHVQRHLLEHFCQRRHRAGPVSAVSGQRRLRLVHPCPWTGVVRRAFPGVGYVKSFGWPRPVIIKQFAQAPWRRATSTRRREARSWRTRGRKVAA